MSQEQKYQIKTNEFNKTFIVKDDKPILVFDITQDFKEVIIDLDDNPLQFWLFKLAKDVYVLDLPHLDKRFIIKKNKDSVFQGYKILYQGKIELILDYDKVKKNIVEESWKNEYFEDNNGKIYFDKRIILYDNFGDIIYHYISFKGKKLDLGDKTIIVVNRVNNNLNSLTPTYREIVKEIPYDEIFEEDEIIYQ